FTRAASDVGPIDLGLAALGEDVVQYLTTTPEGAAEWQGDLPAGEYELRVRVKATSTKDSSQEMIISGGAQRQDVFVFAAEGEEIGRVYLSYEYEVDVPDDQRGLTSASAASARTSFNSFIVGVDVWIGQHRGGAGAVRVSARSEGMVEVNDIVAAIGHGGPVKLSAAR
ncbi:MAG: hypothetical protein ABGY41_23005, partial [Candidatus Poribacteria bacterium]